MSSSPFVFPTRINAIFVNGELDGTGFNLAPGIVLTADHVVRGTAPEHIHVVSMLQPAAVSIVRSVVSHPSADVAALIVQHLIGADRLESFEVPTDYPGLGREVMAYGYPTDPLLDGPDPTARLMKGHVQRHYVQRAENEYQYEYHAYELGMLSLPGLSGGPVFLQDSPTQVVGMVTRAMEVYGTPVWAIAASVVALRDWLAELVHVHSSHDW